MNHHAVLTAGCFQGDVTIYHVGQNSPRVALERIEESATAWKIAASGSRGLEVQELFGIRVVAIT